MTDNAAATPQDNPLRPAAGSGNSTCEQHGPLCPDKPKAVPNDLAYVKADVEKINAANRGGANEGSTRRIIMDSTTGRSGLEIERSHIEGKVARLTATIGGGGVILHLSAAELERLVAAALRLSYPANPSERRVRCARNLGWAPVGSCPCVNCSLATDAPGNA